MLDQLATARRIVEDGQEVDPAWLINTPEGTYLVFTRFDPDKPEERERALYLITRFMTWKLATSFVLNATIGLNEADAMHALLVKRADALVGCTEGSSEEARLRRARRL